MVCPYKENYNCPFVDTAVMDKTTSCTECEYRYESRKKAWEQSYRPSFTQEEIDRFISLSDHLIDE